MTSSPRRRALIVDDEDLARRLVREYLQGHADIDIVGACDNGLDAVKQIGALARLTTRPGAFILCAAL